jgi:hypothetical protein
MWIDSPKHSAGRRRRTTENDTTIVVKVKSVCAAGWGVETKGEITLKWVVNGSYDAVRNL